MSASVKLPSPSGATTDRGHPMPRRTSPEASVTLQHHRLARDASMLRARQEASRKGVPTVPRGDTQILDSAEPGQGESPRRNSSGESHITGKSDPQRWFDRSNQNPAAQYGDNAMDVDPPFFQKESDSSNEDARRPPTSLRPLAYRQGGLKPSNFPLALTQSSSEDFRSIVDDLTVENKRLKEELKRYKQFGPGLMRKDKLFEIKVHGLPARKKRELEATLRDFAASLEGSSEAPSPKRKSKHSTRPHHSTQSKHASSSSSNSRPVDSAYASMSTGQGSSNTSLPRPTLGTRTRSSDRKVENYLDDIPAGLYPGLNPLALNENDKARLIVKKLEQLFTGKITGRLLGLNKAVEVVPSINVAQSTEPGREAVIQQELKSGKKSRSRDNMSSNSNPESGGNDTGSGSGENSGRTTAVAFKQPPDAAPLPEQRPTRPRDLDPDRPQIPSENMEYIRHLGLVPPELLAGAQAMPQDVSPDTDGWVYLNLLANLAQLHILNVSPDFIRRAVREKSTKFQVSPDGRKIRWRGGTEGTKFSSDSSGEASGISPLTEEDQEDNEQDDGSDENGQRKRRRTEFTGPANKKRAMVAPAPPASENFHYKPMFLHKQSSGETSVEDSESQDSHMVDDSNWGNGSRQPSGSGSSPRRRRRDHGAMVFYNGAPFCIDLSGDNGDSSPTTFLTSTGQQSSLEAEQPRPSQWRSLSGSSFAHRPLTDRAAVSKSSDDIMDVTSTSPRSRASSDATEYSDIEGDFVWSQDPHKIYAKPIRPPLEPSGIGGVSPDDHFAVVVTTKRQRHPEPRKGELKRKATDESTQTLMDRLANMSTSSPRSHNIQPKSPNLKIQYVSGKVHRFEPLPLPPPLQFVPPFTESYDSTDYGESTGSQLDEMDDDQGGLASSSDDILSRKVNPHLSDLDEESPSSADSSDVAGPTRFEPRPRVSQLGRRDSAAVKANVDSSVATAGGEESGYSSGMK